MMALADDITKSSSSENDASELRRILQGARHSEPALEPAMSMSESGRFRSVHTDSCPSATQLAVLEFALNLLFVAMDSQSFSGCNHHYHHSLWKERYRIGRKQGHEWFAM
mgnify:CR=1 FL=1